ncbi:YIP1 family protein [Desulforudis sp. 1088]|uniref:YIP1 family protein n=1 Tax=unclassified Candidatus Desulforudis TaxID=2635950 RepID=UPI00349ACC74
MSSHTNLLELVYGVLFDPVATFRRLAESPPLGTTFILITILNAAAVLMGLFTLRLAPHEVFGAVGAGLSVGIALGSFFLWYVKWLCYGAVLHLVAQLFGGTGHARATLVAYGLASLPGLFMFPVQSLSLLFTGKSAGFIPGLASVGLFIWSVVLLVVGMREMHRMETARALAVVFLPAVVLIVLLAGLIGLAVLGLITAAPSLPLPPL